MGSDIWPALGENTRAVHLPPPPAVAQQPLGTPVYRTAAFAFGSSGEYAALLSDALPGYTSHTKVSHVASTTHRQLDDAALAAAGIGPGAVRFSIGLEDGEDLIGDAQQALDALAGSAAPQLQHGPWP
jgi:O-acetylhomoserine/O-acetylserine sulfhydrylase-like pyridoxal-dependent enzyme